MKSIILTTKQCDMLDTIIGEWVTQKERHVDDVNQSIHGNTFTGNEIRTLWTIVQTAYWDK